MALAVALLCCLSRMRWARPSSPGLPHNPERIERRFSGNPASRSNVVQNQLTEKGASGEGPHQKTSKIVKKCQKYFRHFSTFFSQGKKLRKSSKKLKNIFDTSRQFFARHQFSGPFWGALAKIGFSAQQQYNLLLTYS